MAIEFTNKAGETDTKYTRAGQFTLNKDGYLVTEEGDYVLDTQNRRIRLNTLLDSKITDDGTIYQNDQAVARIQVTDFEDMITWKNMERPIIRPIEGGPKNDYGRCTGEVRLSGDGKCTDLSEMVNLNLHYQSI